MWKHDRSHGKKCPKLGGGSTGGYASLEDQIQFNISSGSQGEDTASREDSKCKILGRGWGGGGHDQRIANNVIQLLKRVCGEGRVRGDEAQVGGKGSVQGVGRSSLK